LLGTGQPEKPAFLAPIAQHFEMAEKPGRVLRLVDNDWRLVSLKKQGGISIREIPGHVIVECDVSPTLPKVPKHGGFADLPLPGDKNRLEKPAHFGEFAFQMPDDITHKASIFRII
jgi:hypothetical protein